MVSVKSFVCICKGFEKILFYKINKEYRCSDLVLKPPVGEGVLPVEIIQKSFHVCGVFVITDGTEDEEIHCLKEGGVAADTRQSIRRDTATIP